jgi:hypothetical protein
MKALKSELAKRLLRDPKSREELRHAMVSQDPNAVINSVDANGRLVKLVLRTVPPAGR